MQRFFLQTVGIHIYENALYFDNLCMYELWKGERKKMSQHHDFIVKQYFQYPVAGMVWFLLLLFLLLFLLLLLFNKEFYIEIFPKTKKKRKKLKLNLFILSTDNQFKKERKTTKKKKPTN